MKRKGAKKTRPEVQKLKKTTVFMALHTSARWKMDEDTGRRKLGPSIRPGVWASCNR